MAGDDDFRSGFAALVGRPNVGKSTLLNRLAARKLAIVSEKPQTTRHQIRAILTLDGAQVVFVDTPGFHKPKDFLGDQLNLNVRRALRDVDVAVVMVDVESGVGRGDGFVAAEVAASGVKAILAPNKIDAANASVVEKQLEEARSLGAFEETIPVSAKDGTGVDRLIEAVVSLLPAGPKYYPDEEATDQPIEVMVAELIREKVLLLTSQEVPHSVGVQVESIRPRGDGALIDVEATIVVERTSQKGILIGKGGKLAKQIGTLARVDIQSLLGAQVYLDLKVKARKDWRKDARSLKTFGYLAE